MSAARRAQRNGQERQGDRPGSGRCYNPPAFPERARLNGRSPTSTRARIPRGGHPIRLSKLTLTNIRNHENTLLELNPGLTVFRGRNAAGKSNLLESAYMLAIARSPRAGSDRELVSWAVARRGGHAQVAGVAREGDVTVQVQIDFEVAPPPLTDPRAEPPAAPMSKSMRVNGIERTAAEFVGSANVVLFEADDLALVLGPPSGRRRYLDILISQSDPTYLKTLQRYGRVVRNRNLLLRRMRDGRAGEDELVFWDERLVFEGAAIVERRSRVVRTLTERACKAYGDLTGEKETLDISYRPRLSAGLETNGTDRGESQVTVAETMTTALETARAREIGQGVTVIGPHRDDLELRLDCEAAAIYASRGQARSIALALKLAEAGFVAAATGRTPVLALDDVLSELDEERRHMVLEAAASYEQVLLTTTDYDLVERSFLEQASRCEVDAGKVVPVDR